MIPMGSPYFFHNFPASSSNPNRGLQTGPSRSGSFAPDPSPLASSALANFFTKPVVSGIAQADSMGFLGGNSSRPSGSFVPSESPPAQDPIYYGDAALAKEFGMPQSTAYLEMMENTSYQRAVKDMQKAGLSPSVLFGAGRGQPAGSGFVMPSGGSSRGSGGSSRGFSSGRSNQMNSNAYSLLVNGGALIGTAIGGATKGLWGASIGGAAGGGIGKALAAAYNLFTRK